MLSLHVALTTAGLLAGLVAPPAASEPVTAADTLQTPRAGSVAQESHTGPAPSYDHDWDGDGNADVISAGHDGRLYLYRGNGNGRWLGGSPIGRGWTSFDEIRVAGDWDGDGDPDIIARHVSGNLWLYAGDGTGGFEDWRVIGFGWSIFSDIVAPGDWDGDGNVDLVAIRRSDGSMWLYPGNGVGRFRPARQIGVGWVPLDMVTPVGDWDSDGDVDLMARDPASGRLLLYPGSGTGGFGRPSVAGTGWGGFTALHGPGDFSGDGSVDILARSPDGRLGLYRGSGAGGFRSPYPVVGSGWNPLLLNEPTQVPARVITYSVASLGRVYGDVGAFARHAEWTLRDVRGWALERDIRFDQVPSGGEFTLYLASPSQVAAASPGCSAQYSCRVGDGVYINDERWRRGTDTFAHRSLSEYQSYVINHEVGHWLGLGHPSCPAPGRPAPVMQQQSISLQGCVDNVWPLSWELDQVRRNWL